MEGREGWETGGRRSWRARARGHMRCRKRRRQGARPDGAGMGDDSRTAVYNLEGFVEPLGYNERRGIRSNLASVQLARIETDGKVRCGRRRGTGAVWCRDGGRGGTRVAGDSKSRFTV